MKIALALERFSPFAGGVEAYAVSLAQTLINHGWELHLFGHSWNNEPAGAIFHYIPRLPKLVPSSIKMLSFALHHRKMVESMDFDVVMGFGNTIYMDVYQSHGGVHYYSTRRKIAAIENPIVRALKFISAASTPKYHVRAWIEGAAFRMKKRPLIIAISQMVREDMSRYFHVPEDEIILVYNGVDHSRFLSIDAEMVTQLRLEMGFQQEILYLFMAYDLRKKGIHYLLQAASALKQEEGSACFGIVVVGGKPSSHLKRQVTNLGLDGKVFFAGPTTQPEMYFSACDVLVLPTFYDACSLVVFEAMAAGDPVITTKFNGAGGVIKQGENGFVLDAPQDVVALAQAMTRFLDRDFLHRASQSAKETSLEYGLQKNHFKMLEVFNKVASARSGRSQALE
jgi:UDP-glucose:(heptosyl)LPS alpha-1,3-glucosyltransferase